MATQAEGTPHVSEFEAFLQRHLPQGPFNWSLAFGVCLAFLSQLSSIGKGIQKVGVAQLPELSYRPSVLKQYLASTTWRRGMMLDILGAVFGFTSLTILPISVAQPIFCNGLVLLACYSHFVLKEQLASREWRAIGMCFLGTVLLASTLVPRDWSRTHVGWLQVKLACVLMLVLPLLVLSECGLRRLKRYVQGLVVADAMAAARSAETFPWLCAAVLTCSSFSSGRLVCSCSCPPSFSLARTGLVGGRIVQPSNC